MLQDNRKYGISIPLFKSDTSFEWYQDLGNLFEKIQIVIKILTIIITSKKKSVL
jgi:hypothetical protein